MLPLPNGPPAEVFLETEEDAVFGVRLRRVTYNSGLTDSFLQWQTEKVRTLRAATPERLVMELLPEHGAIDATFLITFLGTYRTFMTAEELLGMIRDRISKHCQMHSLTTISRSNSDSSIGSASTERSRSGISASSGDDDALEARDRLGDPPDLPTVASSSSPVTYDDDDEMTGTEELARSLLSRSFSMSNFSSSSVGGAGMVSQRVRMFSLMSARLDARDGRSPTATAPPRGRARAATVHGRSALAGYGSQDSEDLGSPGESPHPAASPDSAASAAAAVVVLETHTRQGSDGTQRDSGNGTESQEESADQNEAEAPGLVLGLGRVQLQQQQPAAAIRRRLPFSKGEATRYDPVTSDAQQQRHDVIALPGDDGDDDDDVTERPSSMLARPSRDKVNVGSLPPRSLSFSPSSTRQLVGSMAAAPTRAGGRTKAPSSRLRPTAEETSGTSPRRSPNAEAGELTEDVLAVTLIDDDDDDGDDGVDSPEETVTVIDDVSLDLDASGDDDVTGDVTDAAASRCQLGEGVVVDPLDDDPLLSGEKADVDVQAQDCGLRPLSSHGPDPKDIFKSVLSVLRVWLDQYPEDFKTPQLQMTLFGLLEECRISPGQEFEDVYSLAEVLSAESSPLPGATFSGNISPPTTPGAASMKKSNTLVSLHQRHRSTMAMQGALSSSVELATMPRIYLDFLSIPAMKLAEQLTLIDASLFRAVVPYHCLSHFWSRRNSSKPGTEGCASVAATISQFNRVCMLLSTSLLKGLQHRRVSAKENKPSQRAKTIQHWVDIAQCCRILKNYSSLRAIISSLQSTSVGRLLKTWALVDKDALFLFKELCQLSSFSDNDQKTRAILMKEGTSKYSGLDAAARKTKSPKGKYANRYSDWFSSSGFVVQGVVPYLGTFLTDLTMVDSAHQNLTEEGFINFQKRRKEFELLAQLMLFQKACKYTFENDNMIQSWVLQSEVLVEEKCYQCSLELEPEQSERGFIKPSLASPSWTARFRRTIAISSKSKKKKEENNVQLTKKSIDEQANSTATLPFPGVSNRMFHGSLRVDPRKRSSELGIDTSTSSMATNGVPVATPGESPGASSSGSSAGGSSSGRPGSAASDLSPCGLSSSTPERPSWDTWFKDAYRIRVRMETDACEGVYKSFLLRNGDRARAVIERVLQKNLIEERPDCFTLYQISAVGKEVRIPLDANVYYAINTAAETFDFVLRHCEEKTVKHVPSNSSVASKWTPMPE